MRKGAEEGPTFPAKGVPCAKVLSWENTFIFNLRLILIKDELFSELFGVKWLYIQYL